MNTSRLLQFRPVLAAGCFVLLCQSTLAIPAFPGATGFGAETAGGRNGTVIRVTNLNNSGTGSLRAALESTTTPRVVIFDVAGIIELTSHINIRTGGVTVAGQTAPSPGIIVKGASIVCNASDIIIQHLAVRPGNANPTTPSLENRDSFQIDSYNKSAGIQRVLLDHVSGSWSTDEVMSIWKGGSAGAGTLGGPVQDVTISHSLLAEALAVSGRTDSNAHYPAGSGRGHSAGLLIGSGANGVSVVRNVFAWCDYRNPYVNTDATNVQVVNNFIYSPGGGTATQYGNKMNFSPNTGPLTATAKGNWTYLRPDTDPDEHVQIGGNSSHAVQLFQQDNKVFNLSGGVWTPINNDPWHSSVTHLSGRTLSSVRVLTEQGVFTVLSVPYDPNNVRDYNLARVGARPLDRDPVDARIISQIQANNTKPFVNNPGDVGGYPAWPTNPTPRALVPPANPNSDDNGNGYTNLEDWLHGMAAELEAYSGGGGPASLAAASFDTFSDSNALGWKPAGISHWTITSGAYRQNDAFAGARAVMPNTSWSDQVVEALVTPRTLGGTNAFASVHARFRDMDNNYYIVLRSNAVELKKIVNGTPTLLQSVATTISLNSAYKVRLKASGNSISGTVTNVSTGVTTTLPATADSSLTIGSTAIGSYLGTADFDNVFASPEPTAVPVVMDDFDDGNLTGWDTTWTGMSGTWSVTADSGSNGLRQSNGSSGIGARAITPELTNLPSANQSVQADVKPLSFGVSTGFIGLYARFASPTENYYMILRGNRELELKKVTGAGQVELVKKTLPTSFSLTSWHTLRLVVTGTTTTTLRAYVDGVEELSFNDSSSPIVNASKAGVGTYAASAQFDDVIITSP